MSADASRDEVRELRADLESALGAIGRLAVQKRAPGRREARALLVPLGFLALEVAPVDVEVLLERVRVLADPLGAAWLAAVESELRLAGEEYRQSVDPHYLSLPDYDLHYTLQARDRLEARLVAASGLGCAIPEDVLRGVRTADSLLADFIDGGARVRRQTERPAE